MAPDIDTERDTIPTQRLLLRPLQPSDTDAVFALRSDPKVFYWKTPETRKQSDAWLKARLESPKTINHAISLLTPASEQDRIIGILGAHNIPELGYILRPAEWGKGYATEALKAWIEWYWRRYPDGHPSLEGEENGYLNAKTGPGGEASRAVLRKCGFRWYGEEELREEDKDPAEKGTRVVLQEFRLDRLQRS